MYLYVVIAISLIEHQSNKNKVTTSCTAESRLPILDSQLPINLPSVDGRPGNVPVCKGH